MNTAVDAPPGAEVRSDTELLEEYRTSRSHQAFSVLVSRHSRAVYRTCLRIAGNVHDAEDAAQAVFLILARRPDAVSRSLAGWLHGTACRTAWRLVRRRKEIVRSMAAEPAPQLDDLRRELDQALERLPESLREAVVLRYLEGRSEKESARLAGCPQGTLGWRAMEGLNRLRTLLARGGAPVGAGILVALMAKEAAAAAPASVAAVGASVVSSQVAALVEGGLKSMLFAKLKIAAAMVFAVAPALIGAGALAYQALQPMPVRVDEELPAPIAVEKFAKVFDTVKPYPGEWRWREEISWAGTIHEARARASKENKPILVWQSANSPPLGST